jgi:hypothetical protein
MSITSGQFGDARDGARRLATRSRLDVQHLALEPGVAKGGETYFALAINGGFDVHVSPSEAHPVGVLSAQSGSSPQTASMSRIDVKRLLLSLRKVRIGVASGFANVLSTTAIHASNGAAILRMRDNGPSALSEGGSDYRVADYEPLLTRAVAALPSTSTVATRLAIYERARKAQLAQLRTVHPALPEIDVARGKRRSTRRLH